MIIGNFGDVVFQVSSETVQTFENLSWSSAAKYGSHALHMKTEMLEMTGYAPDEVSFEMFLSAFLGVSPEQILQALQQMLKKGTVASLVLGTTVIGKKWVLTKIGRSFKHVYKDGTLVSCQVNVTLQEYE